MEFLLYFFFFNKVIAIKLQIKSQYVGEIAIRYFLPKCTALKRLHSTNRLQKSLLCALAVNPYKSVAPKTTWQMLLNVVINCASACFTLIGIHLSLTIIL